MISIFVSLYATQLTGKTPPTLQYNLKKFQNNKLSLCLLCQPIETFCNRCVIMSYRIKSHDFSVLTKQRLKEKWKIDDSLVRIFFSVTVLLLPVPSLETISDFLYELGMKQHNISSRIFHFFYMYIMSLSGITILSTT